MDIIIFAILIALIGLWVWALFDITRSRFKNQTLNTIWLLAVLFFPVLAPTIYLFSKKTHVLKEPRKFDPKFNRTNSSSLKL